jgi:hypothetical protein
MNYLDDRPTGQSEWITYDGRIEEMIRLRSLAENQFFSLEERDEAYDLAGRLSPSLDEWTHCRRIEERRWQHSRDAKIAKGLRPPHPLSVVSRPEPPKPQADAGIVSPERAKRLLNAVLTIFRDGGSFPKLSPAPPARFVRTHHEYADRYWYNVELERKRRRWMRARKLEYWPVRAIYVEDLDQVRP